MLLYIWIVTFGMLHTVRGSNKVQTVCIPYAAYTFSRAEIDGNVPDRLSRRGNSFWKSLWTTGTGWYLISSQVSTDSRPSRDFSKHYFSIGKACRERSLRSLVTNITVRTPLGMFMVYRFLLTYFKGPSYKLIYKLYQWAILYRLYNT